MRFRGHQMEVDIAGGDSNSIATVYQSDLVPLTLQNVKVVLNGNTTFVSPVLSSGTVVIEGNNYTLDLTSSPSFTINPSASVLFKNFSLHLMVFQIQT